MTDTAQGVGDVIGDAEVVAVDVERDDAWLDLRRTGLGGSDAAAVVGLSRWHGPWETYGRKRGELPDQPDNPRMKRGRDLEPIIAEWFAEESGLVICNPRMVLRSTRWPWMLATPDRLVGPSPSEATAGVEIKATGKHSHDWDDGDAPIEARFQCLHYLAVTGLPRWHLVAHAGGTDDLHHVVIERNAADIANLVDAEYAFWQRVVDGRPPVADALETTRAALVSRWPDVTPGSTVDVDDAFASLLERRSLARHRLNEADADLRHIENEIRAQMADVETAIYRGEKVASWRWQDRREYVVPASRSRVLRIA